MNDPYRYHRNADRIRNRNRRLKIKCACGHGVIDDHRADGHCVWCGCTEVRVVQ